MDEDHAHLARHGPADHRDVSIPSPAQVARQRDLLAGLIGGDSCQAAHSAAQLIGFYGSLGRVLAASPAALQRLLGERETAERIAAARDAVLAGIHEDFVRQPFDLRNHATRRYVVALFAGLTVEHLHAVFLCSRGTYLADRSLSEGSATDLVGHLRQIVIPAIDLKAHGVVLIHNHPSGKVSPSQADIVVTRRLEQCLAELNLYLIDHLIVARAAILSMRGAGLL